MTHQRAPSLFRAGWPQPFGFCCWPGQFVLNALLHIYTPGLHQYIFTGDGVSTFTFSTESNFAGVGRWQWDRSALWNRWIPTQRMRPGSRAGPCAYLSLHNLAQPVHNRNERCFLCLHNLAPWSQPLQSAWQSTAQMVVDKSVIHR